MDALEAILTRRTVPQAKMTGPGPDAAAVQRILAAGAAAPDHGRLTPFRFLTVAGEARGRLGELFAASISTRPGVSAGEIEKWREAPFRAPLLIVVVARPRPGIAKVPEVEQIASAACAAQNILLAAHAQGFVGKWSTGTVAYDPVVKDGLGLGADEHIVGILYLGSPAAVLEAGAARPALESLVTSWGA